MPCTFIVSPTALTPGAAASSSSSVTTTTGCTWTATSNAFWLSITSGVTGSGNGTVAFSVAANAGASSRTGTLTVAGQTITVIQQGTVSCTFTVSPGTVTPLAIGGTQTAVITTTAGCGWTAASNASWLNFTSIPFGTGSASVGYTVAQNSATASRTGTLTIAGRTVTVIQQAGSNNDPPPAPGNLRISP